MAFARIMAVVAALAMATGCAPAGAGAGAASSMPWSRPVELDPWRTAGPTPTAAAIRFALYEDVYEIDIAECPFHLLECIRVDSRERSGTLTVDEVRCSPVAEYNERCTFRLTEMAPGREAVRSRCQGWFETMGTSHYPSRWGVDYGHGETDSRPAIVCRHGRAERRAVW